LLGPKRGRRGTRGGQTSTENRIVERTKYKRRDGSVSKVGVGPDTGDEERGTGRGRKNSVYTQRNAERREPRDQ